MSSLRKGGFLVSKVHQVAGRVFARLLRERGVVDLNPAQGRILFVLWEEDGIPISVLSERTGLEQSTLTRMLDRLEETRHIYRVVSSADRRKQNIYLTEQHRRLMAAYDEVSREMIHIFYHGLDEHEVVQFEHTLERILENLSAYYKQKS